MPSWSSRATGIAASLLAVVAAGGVERSVGDAILAAKTPRDTTAQPPTARARTRTAASSVARPPPPVRVTGAGGAGSRGEGTGPGAGRLTLTVRPQY